MKAVRVCGQPIASYLVERTLTRVCRRCKQKGLHTIEAGSIAHTFYARGGPKKLVCMDANVAWEQRVRGELICMPLR